MKRITLAMLMGLGLLVAPTFTGISVGGNNTSARADDFGVGVRVYDRDDDRGWRWRHRHFWRDRDDDVVIRRYHRWDWD